MREDLEHSGVHPDRQHEVVIYGLHSIDDYRARGWRLLSMNNEGPEPIATMVRT